MNIYALLGHRQQSNCDSDFIPTFQHTTIKNFSNLGMSQRVVFSNTLSEKRVTKLASEKTAIYFPVELNLNIFPQHCVCARSKDSKNHEQQKMRNGIQRCSYRVTHVPRAISYHLACNVVDICFSNSRENKGNHYRDGGLDT